MHPEILSRQQVELIPLLRKYKKRYYLDGGTATALHMGHRRSIDLDLFTLGSISFKISRHQLFRTGGFFNWLRSRRSNH